MKILKMLLNWRLVLAELLLLIPVFLLIYLFLDIAGPSKALTETEAKGFEIFAVLCVVTLMCLSAITFFKGEEKQDKRCCLYVLSFILSVVVIVSGFLKADMRSSYVEERYANERFYELSRLVLQREDEYKRVASMVELTREFLLQALRDGVETQELTALKMNYIIEAREAGKVGVIVPDALKMESSILASVARFDHLLFQHQKETDELRELLLSYGSDAENHMFRLFIYNEKTALYEKEDVTKWMVMNDTVLRQHLHGYKSIQNHVFNLFQYWFVLMLACMGMRIHLLRKNEYVMQAVPA